MKKDIITLAVEEVAVVVVPRSGKSEEELWEVHLVNESDHILENVIVSSKGYGELEGREKTTTVLRYFFQDLPAKSSVLIEPIQPSLFGINNEYWISFNKGADMLDRKFVFPADTIASSQLSIQDVINKPGIAAK